ncbi:MAG: sugar kinase [Lachnospiraceae bacterium]|uniref:sugar kinase n=1 Tax=Parablautia sp. Marseille-Q6255 TaxID=3039593 RepID=UPI0024BCF62B|nr:sugar kinase [Parablautia sp. Marseille-Q6255]
MKKVVGFGDFLVRLSPPGYLKFIQADTFDINYTGAEANVLVSLSCMGVKTELVTRVPDHAIADSGLAMMRKFGVGVEHVVKGGERMGVFYLEKGASQRPSRIVYDRKYSAIAMAEPGMFDWDAAFEGASHFHITGITPALGTAMPEVSIGAVRAAKEHGLTVSCDLNYRKNMWSADAARDCMEKMLQYVDILIANEEDADKVLGIRAADTDVTTGKLNKDGYVDVAAQLCDKYGVREVGITLRRSISASDNEWGALLYSDGKPYFSRTYPIHIVDRVGGGDSFAAGLLYGDLQGFESQKKIEYAAAASCLKHSIELDFNLSSVSEIELLMNGDASGRVQR